LRFKDIARKTRDQQRKTTRIEDTEKMDRNKQRAAENLSYQAKKRK